MLETILFSTATFALGLKVVDTVPAARRFFLGETMKDAGSQAILGLQNMIENSVASGFAKATANTQSNAELI